MAIPKKNVNKLDSLKSNKLDSFIEGAQATKADTTKKSPLQEAEEIINFRLPKSLIRKIKVHAALEGKDLKELAREVFEGYFEGKNIPGID